MAKPDEPLLPLGTGVQGDGRPGLGGTGGVWLHPDWLPVWRTDWPLLPSHLRGRVAAARVARVQATAYGCCGAQGGLLCDHGHALGELYADCAGVHHLHLDDAAVERSDRGEGWWTTHRLDLPALCEAQGTLAAGRRVGEWTVSAMGADPLDDTVVGLLTYGEEGGLVEELWDL